MLGAADILVHLWLPAIIGSLFALGAKGLMKVLPGVPEGAKNLIMRAAGWVRNISIAVVLFFFAFLFWYFSYLARESQFMQRQYNIPAQQNP